MFYALCFTLKDEMMKEWKNVNDVIENCHYYNDKYIFRRSGSYIEKVNKNGIVVDHVSIKIFFHNVCQLRMMNN